MNGAHLHLLLNHFPIIVTLVGFLVLLWSVARGSEEVKKTALGLLVLGAVLTLPTYLTGEPAEDLVVGLPGVSKTDIERHQEAAGIAAGSLAAVGVAALAGLAAGRRGRVPPALVAVITFLALVAIGLVARAANLGGEIRHSEIRPASLAAGAGGAAGERRPLRVSGGDTVPSARPAPGRDP
jgi:uncharacterized membrane protein